MNWCSSENSKMLRKTARDFLSQNCPRSLVREMQLDKTGYSKELWQKMAELGWMGLAFPEKYGGGGGDFSDLTILLEEMGRVCLPSPFLSTVLCGLIIQEVGNETQKRDFITNVADGKVIISLALSEAGGDCNLGSIKLRAQRNDHSYVLDGRKLFVPYAHVADIVLCLAQTAEDDIGFFLVGLDSKGIDTVLLQTIAGDKQCEVTFNHTNVPLRSVLGQPGEGRSYLQKLLAMGAIGKCAEMVGGAQEVLHMVVSYAKQRVQFDRPIGSFQAIQHHCANMAIDVEGMTNVTYRASWMLSQGFPCAKEVAIAKAWTSEAYKRVIALGHQVIGGVGVMRDHDLPLFTKRAIEAEVAFGDVDFHRDMVAKKIGI